MHLFVTTLCRLLSAGREVVGLRLARLLGARYYITPPKCLANFSYTFQPGTVLRRAFYALSLYATAFDIKVLLSLRRGAVINGFWTDQSAFAISRAFPNGSLPPASSDVYKFPHDLLQPDLVYYLNYPDNWHYQPLTTRNPSSWKPRMMEVYQQLHDHRVSIVDLGEGYSSVIDNLYNNIREQLGNELDLGVSYHSHRYKTDYMK